MAEHTDLILAAAMLPLHSAGWQIGGESALVKHDQPLAEPQRHVRPARPQEQRAPVSRRATQQLSGAVLAGRAVYQGRLVERQQARPVEEREGQGKALAPPWRQAGRRLSPPLPESEGSGYSRHV